MTHARSAGDVAVAPAMRVILALAGALVFLAGLQLFVFPARTADWFAWTIDPPMTAVFLGASYWSSAVLEVAGARSARWGRARLTVWAVLVFTTLTLVVTLVHVENFHLGAEHPTTARVVTWWWLGIYAGVPLAMLVALVLQSRMRTTAPPGVRRPLPALLRALLLALGLLLVATGVALLVDPVRAADLWAWPLTPLTGRAVGAWLVGLGWAAAHAWVIDDADDVRPLGWTGAAFVVLQAVALLRYGGELGWGEWQAVAYLAGLAWIGAVAAWVLAVRAAPGGVVTGADAEARGRPR